MAIKSLLLIQWKLDLNLIIIHIFLDKITGSPCYIPDFDSKIDPIEYFEANKENVSYTWGKETSGKFGVRTNYLEKHTMKNQ